jgi:hypothetical protein
LKERRYVLAGALVALALLFLLLWWGEGEPGRPPAEEPDEAASRAQLPPPAPRPLAAEREALAIERVEDEPEPSEELAPDELDHPFAFRLRLNLRGRFGVPVADATVFVAPEQCGFTRWPEPSTGRGQVDLRWRGRRRTMVVTVAVLAHGVLQPMRRVELEHDVPRQLALGVRSMQQSVTARARVASRRDQDVERDARLVRRERERVKQGRMERLDELDILCGRSMLMFGAFRCVECHEPGRVGGYRALSSAGAMRTGLHPHAVFQDLGAHQRDERGVERERRKLARRLVEQVQQESSDRRGGTPRGGYVVGVVTDLEGRPVEGVPVASVDEHGELVRSTLSEDGGRFRLGPFETGPVNVIAAGGRAGFAATRLTVVAGQKTEWTPELRRFRTVAGTVRDDRRRPLEGWFVELSRDEGEWAAVAQTDRDGAFAVHGVPGTVVTSVWPRDAARGMPVIYGTAAMVDAQELELMLHRDVPTRARLRAHVGVPAALQGARVDARVLQVETGVVSRLAPVGHEDAFELRLLPPGAYRLQVGATGAGWVETGDVVVDGRGLWDVGRIELPRPGRVQVRCVGGLEPLREGQFSFYRRTDDCDVLSRHRLVDDAFELPPGEHVLVWNDGGRRRAVGFEIVAGGVATVVLAAARSR